MSRESGDEIQQGRVFNGFDYALQAWVVDGIVQGCHHPSYMPCGCSSQVHAGRSIYAIPGAEVRADAELKVCPSCGRRGSEAAVWEHLERDCMGA